MTPAERAHAYLAITPEYGLNIGGFVWSYTRDAIERWNGTTFAFEDEIREVLSGVFARPPVPPFDFVLAMLRILRDGPDTSSVAFDRLWRAYTSAKGSTNLLRNSGLLISELCLTLPSAVNSPSAGDVSAAIGQRLVGDDWTMPESSPMPRTEFEARIEARLEQFDDSRLLHWLKHGCDPLTVGERLAEPLDTLPVRVAKLLALIRREPRLAGAAALVPAIDGALTVPARRRSPDAVPQGGYCDVTTRGEPERLLPTQFALERDEFVRRFAERELLYFQREEPHAARKPERLIVLDQGVRTWGGVRLALAAAALVLMKKDAKRVGRVRLATTSAPRPIDILEAELDYLAKLLEASDLTPQPGPCLATVLAAFESDDPRDVILLTHPRALRESVVVTALRERFAEDRVFALAVDERGEAELHNWTETGPVAIRKFRVDLAAAEAVSVEPKPVPRVAAFQVGRWTGDIEPVPFPFRPGLVSPPQMFAFDADGDWLVAAGKDGILHGLAWDGTPVEVLPRPFRDGMVLKEVEAVLGVPGGVAVCGRMPALPLLSSTHMTPGVPVVQSSASTNVPADRYVAAHYDRKLQQVLLHDLGPAEGKARWLAFPDLNCVAVAVANHPALTLDLGSGELYPREPKGHRAALAFNRAMSKPETSPCTLPAVTRWTQEPNAVQPYLFVLTNTIQVCSGKQWDVFEPMRDGKPLLAGASIVQAQLAGDTLALTVKRSGERLLLVIGRAENRILGELNLPSVIERLALSPDGRSIAFMRPFRTLTVARSDDIGTPLVEAKPAALHNQLMVRLANGPLVLLIRVGNFEHVFQVSAGELTHRLLTEASNLLPENRLGTVYHPPTVHDISRFPPREIAHQHGWRAVPDRLGQVLLYRESGALAAAFLIRRERAAAWIPGDVFWGDPLLIGGPASPDAAHKIGAHLAPAEVMA